MALRNVLGTGSYGVIDRMHVDKSTKQVAIDLHVYETAARAHLVTMLHFHLIPAPHTKEVEAILATMDAVPSDGKLYAVPSQARYASKNAQGEDVTHEHQPDRDIMDRTVLLLPDGARYLYRFDGLSCTPVNRCTGFTNADYDEYFATPAQSNNGSNIYKAAYELVKQHPALAHAEDA